MNKTQIIEKTLNTLEEFIAAPLILVPLLDLRTKLQEELKMELFNNQANRTPSEKRRAKSITSFVKGVYNEGYRGNALDSQGQKVITDTLLMIVYNSSIEIPENIQKMDKFIPPDRIDEMIIQAKEAEGTDTTIESHRLQYLKKLGHEVVDIEGQSYAIKVLLDAFNLTDHKSLTFRIPTGFNKTAYFTTPDGLIYGLTAGFNPKKVTTKPITYKEETPNENT